MANEKNLVPNDKRTPSERRENARKAGQASGAARRRKKSLKEAVDLYLSLPVTDKRRANKLKRRQLDPEDIDNQMAMVVGLVEAASCGDARAAKVVMDMLGDDGGSNGNQEALSVLYEALEEPDDENNGTV